MNKFLRDKLQLVTGLIFGNFFAMKWSKIAIQNKLILIGLYDSLLMDLGQDQFCNWPIVDNGVV